MGGGLADTPASVRSVAMRPAMLAALALALAALTHAVAPEAGPPTAPRGPVVADAVGTEAVSATFAPTHAVVIDTTDTEAAEVDSVVVAPPESVVVEEVAVEVAPARYASPATGFALELPVGWDGPSSVEEADLPAYAHYTFANAAPGSSLAGVTLHVERILGLNALDQQRWTRGLTPYGYHGLRPVGPAPVPLAGLGIELAGPGVGGAVAFVQRGQTFWAVHVRAPEAVWAGRQAEVLALLLAVEIP